MPDDFMTDEEMEGLMSSDTPDFISDEDMAAFQSKEKPVSAGDYLKKTVTSGVKRAGQTVADLYRLGREWHRASPQWAGGMSPNLIPLEQIAMARRIVSGEVDRVRRRADQAAGAEPGSLEQFQGVVGAVPVVGESLSTIAGAATGRPEDVGEAAAEALMTFAPTGRIKGRSGVVRRPRLRESRLRDVTQATGAGPAQVPFMERHLDDIDLPVRGRRGVEEITSRSRHEAGVQVRSAERRLAAEGGSVTADDIVDSMDPGSRPREYFDPETGESRVVDVTGDPELSDAIAKRRSEIARQYEDSPIDLAEVVERKREAQAVARRAKLYDQTPGGPPVSPKAVAAGEEANALKSAIEAAAEKGDKAAADYLRAATADSVAIAVNEPVIARRNALLSAKTGGGAHGAELAGRAVGMTSGQAAGASAARALAGFGAMKFWNSPLWRTASARTKKHLITVLETEGFDAFRQEAARMAVIESRRRRAAEEAIRNQGEGVVGP